MVKLITINRPHTELVWKGLIHQLRKVFSFKLEDRIRVVADSDQFNDSDPAVYKQLRGMRPHYYEVYWDNVWICDFDDRTDPDKAFYKFMVGFKNAFENDEVHLHAPDEYDSAKQHKRAEDMIQEGIKKLEQTKIEGDKGDVVRQVLRETLEEKKQEKKKIRQKAERKYGK